ncbi:MAG: hypothetical protein BWY45_02551 [Euryarchaeota archaeon ADurb.Bin294]|nr:MAG: hypothetical protein BWY45_02551 [Euryarchaeota archaeon ADurb.Bin294]
MGDRFFHNCMALFNFKRMRDSGNGSGELDQTRKQGDNLCVIESMRQWYERSSLSNILRLNCEEGFHFSIEDLNAYEMSLNLPGGTMGQFIRRINDQNVHRQRMCLSFCKTLKMRLIGLVSALVCVIYFLVRYPVI